MHTSIGSHKTDTFIFPTNTELYKQTIKFHSQAWEICLLFPSPVANCTRCKSVSGWVVANLWRMNILMWLYSYVVSKIYLSCNLYSVLWMCAIQLGTREKKPGDVHLPYWYGFVKEFYTLKTFITNSDLEHFTDYMKIIMKYREYVKN